MPRNNQIKGKPVGNQNEGRQKIERQDRASEAGQSGRHESYGPGTGNTDLVSGEEKIRIGGGNQSGGGSARRSDR